MSVLSVRNLHVRFGQVPILRGVSFDLHAGETLGVVGESGCGKSMTGTALMGMVPPPGVASGSIRFEGRELIGQGEKAWAELRGDRIAMVMQDPFSSLNPVMRVGDQIAEVFRIHQNLTRRAAWTEAVAMLDHVGVPDPEASAKKFPHQMSGGQRQRVVIAIAFAGRPAVLVADEPTTALDVTLQAQVLKLLRELQSEYKTAVMFISHDIDVIAEVSGRIAVFYAGRVVEEGPSEEVLTQPKHPYTQALLQAVPRLGIDRLASIAGQPPRFGDLPSGCPFRPRCEYAHDRCAAEPELLFSGTDHHAACWLANRPAPLS